MSRMTEGQTSKISLLVLVVIFITLILSFLSIYISIEAFLANDDLSATYFLIVGFIGLSISAYMLSQTRRRIRIAIKPPPIMTTITCEKCGFKNIREFQRGDYIFKEVEDTCPKCKEKMYISAIYREVKEKKEEKWL